MIKYKLIIVLFSTLLTVKSFSQGSSINTIQYENCSDAKIIDIDSIRLKSNYNRITLIIFRAEGIHSGSDDITPLATYLKSYDPNFIDIVSYDIKSHLGANTCYMQYKLNGKIEKFKPLPPILFITSSNKKNLQKLIEALNTDIIKLNASDNYAILNSSYLNATEFYSSLNSFLSKATKGVIDRKPLNQYGFVIGLGSFLQQYKSANTIIGRSNQSFEKSPLFVNINGFYKTHLSEKVYLKFGLDLLYYSSSLYNKNLYTLPVSNTYITNPNYSISPTNPLAKTNYLVVGLSASAGYKIKLANKLLLNLEGGFCVGKSIHGWSAANFNVTQGTATTTIKNNSSFSDKISVYFIANPNIEYALNKNCNLHFGLFSARGFSKMSSNSNYQFINDNGRYSALENATDKLSSQSLSFTTGVSFNLK